MQYWLIKSEPDAWSWDEQKAAGAKGTEWTGIRNHTAKLNMMKMKKGDRAFFYHSNIGKEIVGIIQVIATARPDSTADLNAKGEVVWECVEVEAVKPLPSPVTLATIKATPELENLELVKLSRLSVSKVSDEEWAFICKMGGL